MGIMDRKERLIILRKPGIGFLKQQPAALFLMVSLLLPHIQLCASLQHNDVINVGVVINLGSQNGKNLHSCISMAISDFYASKLHYKTRLALHTRDSRGDGDPTHALSSALDLLENVKVQALVVGPETGLETKSLGALGNKARVPIFSFSSSIFLSSGEYPFLLQINQDQTLQFKGIASLVSLYQWKTVSVIHEDTEDGKDSIPYLVGSLQERNIRVTCRTAISPSSSDDHILDELLELAILHQTIFIVHLSPLLASHLFRIAKRMGMVKEGYAWIVTDKTMNQFQQLQSMDWEVVQSMQGVVGLKANISSSSPKLRDLSLRWKRDQFQFYNEESMELDVIGIWAYDTIWALAESIETLAESTGEELVDALAKTRFTGLSGEFQVAGGRLHSEAFEIVNVIGKGERSVGLWSLKHGIVKERSPSSSIGVDEAIIWPGITTIAPKGLFSGKKLRIAVLNSSGFKQFLSIQPNDSASNTTSITGFSVDVFHAAISSLDYEVPFEFIPYVDRNGNNLGSYSDLVHELYLQNYDGIVGDITITGNRSLYVDFTVTYTDPGIGTVVKRDSDDIWFFLRPLGPDVWFAIAAFLALTGLVVWVIEHGSNTEFQGDSVAYNIGTLLWFGFSTLFYAQRERLKSNLSRLVVIVSLFSVFILTSTYTATLSSMLTLQRIELGSSGEYLGTHLGSFVGGAIANNLNFRDDRLKLYSSPEEYAEALSRGVKHGGVRAIVDEIPYLKVLLAQYGNDYTMVASQSTTSGFGFAFQKNQAQLVSDLSKAIIRLREEGKLAVMENLWVKSRRSLVPENDATTPNILNLRSFGGLFLASFLCCGLVLLVHFCSILLRRLDDSRNVILVLREGGILGYFLEHIAHLGRQMPIR